VSGTDGVKAPSCLGFQDDKDATCPSGTAADWEYNFKMKRAGTITSLMANAQREAGAGNTNTYRVLVNGVAVMSCTISGATETACQATGSVALVSGDYIQVDFKETTGNAPDGGHKVHVTIN
jgi:hypothetical protein